MIEPSNFSYNIPDRLNKETNSFEVSPKEYDEIENITNRIVIDTISFASNTKKIIEFYVNKIEDTSISTPCLLNILQESGLPVEVMKQQGIKEVRGYDLENFMSIKLVKSDINESRVLLDEENENEEEIMHENSKELIEIIDELKIGELDDKDFQKEVQKKDVKSKLTRLKAFNGEKALTGQIEKQESPEPVSRIFLDNLEHFDKKQFGDLVANMVNRHFGKKYKHDPGYFGLPSSNIISRKIDNKEYKVFRKKHGLAHGVRQGYLALAIVEFALTNGQQFQSPEGRAFAKWVQMKNSTDPTFRQKLLLVSSYQRTGRESEASSTSHPARYCEYERQDAKNLQKDVNHFKLNNLFGKEPLESNQEFQKYKEALLWTTASEGKLDKNDPDLINLRKILHAAHDLDLRRLPHFNPERIQVAFYEELFGKNNLEIDNTKGVYSVIDKTTVEYQMLAKMWDVSGAFLEATGDRDVVSGRDVYGDVHFLQAANPEKMVNAILATQVKAGLGF